MDGTPSKQYLGDGVYAYYDGYQIWLETTRYDGIRHSIAIDHNTFEALFHYGHTLGFTVKDLIK